MEKEYNLYTMNLWKITSIFEEDDEFKVVSRKLCVSVHTSIGMTIPGRSTRIHVYEKLWDGTLESLPAIPALVRYSKKITCSKEDLGAYCHRHGMLCFKRKSILNSEGKFINSDKLVLALEDFFK